MKTILFLAITLPVLVCKSSAETNYISVAAGQARLIAGHAKLPGVPTSQRCFVYSYYFTFEPTIAFIAWSGSYWGFPPQVSTNPPVFDPGYGFAFTFGPNNSGTVVVPDPPAQVLPLQLAAGYSLVCCQSNTTATFEMIVGRPPDEGTKLYRLVGNGTPSPPVEPYVTNFSTYVFTGGSWIPEEPIADIGEAVWVYQPPIISNPRLVGDQFSFDALTAWGSSMGVEFSDTLPSDSWFVLTNLPGTTGGIVSVTDSNSVNITTQRFYRLKH